MYIENLCCVAKGLQKAAEKFSPVVWVYTAGEDEEAVDIFNQNFFYDVIEKLRTDDLLLIYTPLESTKIYWAKIIKIHNNITLEAISTGGGAGGDVISVNGKNGVVVLSATDILNQAQLDAVNSGITAEKVAEYDHNLEEFEQLNGEVATLEAEQQTIKSDLGDLGDQVIENNNAIATKNDIFQLSVFPDLNTPNVPNPFQYVGETIGSAIKGHFYEKRETDFTQWQRNDNQTFIVTIADSLVEDGVYQADGETMIGTITEISDDAMTYIDTDGQSVSTTYHSVFHTSGFEEVYTFGDDIDLSDYAKRTEVYTRDNADALFVKNAEKGQANGVATLNSSGVIPNEQVNISSLNVKGTWDASTNTPALTNGVGESGDFYITSVAGTVDFGAGEIAFAVGDWALYTDSGVWEKSVNASAVQSVNGKTGLVNVLDTDVLNEDQLKAVNSGIDEVKVQQIETNKTDIAETKTSLEELSMQVATNTGNIETLQTTTEGLRADVANLNIPTATSQLTNDSGYQTSEQVSATVTSEVAKIVADAPEDFNTLKEMSDWITEHKDDASAMNSAILENKNNIANIINDTDLTSTTSTLSASKVKEAVRYSVNTQDGKEKYIKFNLNMATISVTDIYGGKIEIIGANNSTANPTYKTAKVVRFSYGDWSSYDATQAPATLHTKIGELYYYSVDNYYYLKLYNYAHFVITGLSSAPETVGSLPAEISEMTLIPESQYATKSDLGSNVALTNISFNSTYIRTYVDASLNTYVVKNGVCYVTLDVVINQNVTTAPAFTLPKALMPMYFITPPLGVEDGVNGAFNVLTNGSVLLHNFTTGKRYMISFSYPVEE